MNNKLNLPSRNINKIAYGMCEYILAITLILNCRSVWMTLRNIRGWFPEFLLLLLLCAVFGCCISKSGILRQNITRGILLSCAVFSYMIISLLITNYNKRGFLKFIIAVVAIIMYYYICCRGTADLSIFNKYRNIVFFLAGFSLFMWLICSVSQILPSTGYVYTSWTGTDYDAPMKNFYNVYYEYQYIRIGGIRIARNCAIFTEAPMSSFHFCLALLIEVFLEKRNSKIRKIILIIAILSTFSSTGYLILIAIIILKFLLKRSTSVFWKVLKYFLVPLLVVGCVFLAYTIVIQKLETRSGSIRLDDFIAGYKAWKENIIFGAGFGNDNITQRFMLSWRSYNRGFSNSIMQILVHGGIYLAIPYAICSISGIYTSVIKKQFDHLLFSALFLSMLSVTIVEYQYITILVLIYFLHFNTYILSMKKQDPFQLEKK